MDNDNPLLDVGQLNDAAVSPSTAVAALALNFAMKYHDINTVQDGTLYQQYKLEGRNMTPLHLDMVFETARRFEEHIITAPNRLAELIIEGVAEAVMEGLSDDEFPDGADPDDGAHDASTKASSGRDPK